MHNQHKPALIFIAGRDPTVEIGGGHASYVRSHAFAARAAGYAPKLYCVSEVSGTSEQPYGTLIRVPARGRPCRQTRVGFHAPHLVSAALADMPASEGQVIIHSFGVWGHVGAELKTALHARGQSAAHVMSMYTTYVDEAEAHLRSAARYGLRARLSQWLELQWIRIRVARLEHAALLQADRVTVNYQSVAALIRARYPDVKNIEQVTYGPETAFTAPELTASGASMCSGAFGAADCASSAANGSTASSASSAAPNVQDVPDVPTTPDVPPRLLTIALQRPKKGVDTLLRALGLLKSRGDRFAATLVGGGPLVAFHKRLADDLNLGDTTTLTGFVPDVVPYLRAADIFLMPSRREESGSIAVLQAMQAGCAVVCSNIDGLREDLIDGETAILIPPDDATALADAVQHLITDTAFRQTLARNAHAAYTAQFSDVAQSRAMDALYRSLCLPRG